jgi:hypothetical protein
VSGAGASIFGVLKPETFASLKTHPHITVPCKSLGITQDFAGRGNLQQVKQRVCHLLTKYRQKPSNCGLCWMPCYKMFLIGKKSHLNTLIATKCTSSTRPFIHSQV